MNGMRGGREKNFCPFCLRYKRLCRRNPSASRWTRELSREFLPAETAGYGQCITKRELWQRAAAGTPAFVIAGAYGRAGCAPVMRRTAGLPVDPAAGSAEQRPSYMRRSGRGRNLHGVWYLPPGNAKKTPGRNRTRKAAFVIAGAYGRAGCAPAMRRTAGLPVGTAAGSAEQRPSYMRRLHSPSVRLRFKDTAAGTR